MPSCGPPVLRFAIPVPSYGQVDFVYEPPQEGSADRLSMQRDTAEEKQVRGMPGAGISRPASTYSWETSSLSLLSGGMFALVWNV